MKKRISRILGVGLTLALLSSLLVGIVPASANVTSAALTVTHATPSLADDISQTGVTYTLTFQISATITNPQSIIVSFPAGTGLGAATATLSASSGIGTDAFTGAPAAVGGANPFVITVPAPGAPMNAQGAIGAGALIQLVIGNVTNAPATGTYTLGVSTTTEPVSVASDSFTLVAPTIPGVPGIVYGKNAAGNTLVTLTGADCISTVINWSPQIVRVEVGPGTYDETAANFTLDGIIQIPAGVTVISSSGAANTIITDDGPIAPNGVGGCVQLNGATSILDGFTVRGNGVVAASVNINAAGATVRNCILSGSGGMPALWANAGGVSASNTISAATGQQGFHVDAAATSTGDTFSAAGTGLAIQANANLTLTNATVTGASGVGLQTTAGTTTVSGCSFSNLNVAINATGGTISVGTTTIDGCGFASTTVPTGAIQIGAGTIRVIGSTITNGPNAIARVTGAGDATSVFKFNTFTGNAASFVNTAAGGGTAILDATNNWWGSSAGPTVASSAVVAGIGVITSPWLIASVSNVSVSLPGALALNSQATNGVNVAVTNNVDAPTFIATANYTGNPVTAAPPADTVRSFDVYIAYAPGQGTNEIATISFFGITNANAQVWAYSQNQDTYVLCTTQRIDMFDGSVVVTVRGVNATGGLTSPNLGNMMGLEFVLTAPSAPVLGAPPAISTLRPLLGDEEVAITPILFEWAAVANATGYEWQISEDIGGVPWAVIKDSRSPTTNQWVSMDPLKYDTTYLWRVRAVLGTTVGDWVESHFTTAAEPEEPPPPIEIVQQDPPIINIPDWPDTIYQEQTPIIPDYLLWVVVGVGAVLVIAVIVLIVRTRRVA